MRVSHFFHNRSLLPTILVVTLFAFLACEEEVAAPQPPIEGGSAVFAFVTTTDFSTGSSSAIWQDQDLTTNKNVATIHSDAVVRYFDGLVYVVNRFGADNIQCLDPASGFAVVNQFSVGNGSDPHDIVVTSPTRAIVSRYNETDLWLVDPTTGTKVSSIDLSALADGDGIPEIDRLLHHGSHVFITVQRIDRDTDWGPVDVSYVAVYDLSGDSLVDTDMVTAGVQHIAMTGTNPFSEFQTDPVTGNLAVACVGDWVVHDGGVELIDPTTLASKGFLAAESVLEGDITDFVLVNGGHGFVVLTDAGFNTSCLRFDRNSGLSSGTVYAPGGFVIQDIELAPSGVLYLADRTPTAPGIRIYNVVSGIELTTTPIDVGLAPFDILFGTKR